MCFGGSCVFEVVNVGIFVWLEVCYKNVYNKVIVIDLCGVYLVLVIGSFNFM